MLEAILGTIFGHEPDRCPDARKLMRDVIPKLRATRHLIETVLNERINACHDEDERRRLSGGCEEIDIQCFVRRAMSFRACDLSGRLVFFKERSTALSVDCYLAYSEIDAKAYFYRVRHRNDGPAIVGGSQGRQWFIEGEEVTQEIEEALLPYGVKCFDNLCDFRLKEEMQGVLEIMRL